MQFPFAKRKLFACDCVPYVVYVFVPCLCSCEFFPPYPLLLLHQYDHVSYALGNAYLCLDGYFVKIEAGKFFNGWLMKLGGDACQYTYMCIFQPFPVLEGI